jgi:hypothetical protein
MAFPRMLGATRLRRLRAALELFKAAVLDTSKGCRFDFWYASVRHANDDSRRRGVADAYRRIRDRV